MLWRAVRILSETEKVEFDGSSFKFEEFTSSACSGCPKLSLVFHTALRVERGSCSGARCSRIRTCSTRRPRLMQSVLCVDLKKVNQRPGVYGALRRVTPTEAQCYRLVYFQHLHMFRQIDDHLQGHTSCSVRYSVVQYTVRHWTRKTHTVEEETHTGWTQRLYVCMARHQFLKTTINF
jgi:hypothetical protein